jgi:hypothetical protein
LKLKTDKDTIQIKQVVELPLEGYTLSDREMAHADEAARAIALAFIWNITPEGEAFWCSVHARLKQLATRGY